MNHMWGVSRTVYSDRYSSAELAIGKAGGYSSWHHHEDKAQVVVCTSGLLWVDVEYDGNVDSTLLKPGEGLCIEPYRVHRLVWQADGTAIEVYTSRDGEPVRENDIVRRDVGGIGEPRAL